MNATIERATAVALALATFVGVVTGLERYRKSLTLHDLARVASPRRPVAPPAPAPALIFERHDTAPLEGPSPFLLASEVESGKDYRTVPPPAPPPDFVLQGLIVLSSPAQVIVNGEAVSEGESFEVAGTRVTVVSVKADRATFTAGGRAFERRLAPLSKGQ
jgi:hypothetical protein